MSARRQKIRVFAFLFSIAVAANSASAASGSNLILFIPEALPALAVDPTNAPTLARLRYEGVSFVNSHSGFPSLVAHDDDLLPQSDLNPQALVAAATDAYVTAFISDRPVAAEGQSPGLERLLTITLPQFKEATRPFFLVYRLAEPAPEPPAGNQPRPAFKPNPRPADAALQAIEAKLKELGLDESTNIVIAAEHGFSRVLKLSNTSRARTLLPREDTLGTLPPGFLAINLLASSAAAFRETSLDVNLEFSALNDTSRSAAEANRQWDAVSTTESQPVIAPGNRARHPRTAAWGDAVIWDRLAARYVLAQLRARPP